MRDNYGRDGRILTWIQKESSEFVEKLGWSESLNFNTTG